MTRPTVLICGGGIAGPTLAYGLARNGFCPTVVERAGDLRSSGNPVDVRGGAVRIADGMGILPRLREASTHATGFAFVTASGRRIGPLRLGRPRGDEVELPRADLAAILTDAARGEAEFLLGDSITELSQDAGGVDVTFRHAAPRRFDLVVGADGLHSTVRRLVFGPEEDFVHHLGLSIATLPLGRAAAEPGAILMYNTPGRSLTVHPGRGSAGVAFIFRSTHKPAHQDDHKQIVLDAYAGSPLPPEVPDLLDRVRAADDLYFDSISRVRLPSWSHGRVTLAGDAASCVSLFGDGSSLAMIGAATLAEALAATPRDHAAAFRGYEARHRKASYPFQRGYVLSAAVLVPATRAGLAARDLAARALPRERRRSAGPAAPDRARPPHFRN